MILTEEERKFIKTWVESLKQDIIDMSYKQYGSEQIKANIKHNYEKKITLLEKMLREVKGGIGWGQ